MSTCILLSNADYRNLIKGSNLSEGSLNYVIKQYWQEHPEKAVEGKEEYPSLEYVNKFFDTAVSIVDDTETIELWRENDRKTYTFDSKEDAVQKKESLAKDYGNDAVLMWDTKDGKTHVKVPRPIVESEGRGFEFNREQKYAIATIADWLMDRKAGIINDSWIVLEGEAGTGKTSIINDILLNSPTLYGGTVITGAVSNQATDNIIDKLSDQISQLYEINRKTVAGMLGLKQDTSTEKKGFIRDPFSKEELFDADVAIIDEASMITEQLVERVKDAAKWGIPVLFIGDAAQINPIREGVYFDEHPEIDKDQPSPVFISKDEHTVIALKERVRQGEGSPILELASDYRQAWENNTPIPKIQGRKSSADGRLVFTSKPVSQLLQDLIPVFQEAVHTNNPNLIHIVPYNKDYDKNGAVRARSALWWNQKIYDALHPKMAGTYVFQPGDLVRFDDSFVISENEIIPNSENAQVLSISEEYKDTHGVRFYNVTLKLSNGSEVTVPVISQDLQNQRFFSSVIGKMFAEAKKLYGVEKKVANQNTWKYKDSYANVTFSYALNVHRAQGSTYDITILDQDNFDTARWIYESKEDNKQLASLEYTAVTRAKNVLLVASQQAEDADMKVDLLATNKLFNEARKGKPVTTDKGDSSVINKQLNTAQSEESQSQENTTTTQIRDTEVFNNVSESQQIINSDRTILSNEELAYWNKEGLGEMPRILVGSEHSDPAFHAKQILDIINGRASVRDYKGNLLTGHDFAGLYLITKHDGLPMLELLEAKIPKLIHFSITTLGGSQYEPGVMHYNDLLDRIEEYIQQGLDPESVTIRIDPIVPGVTNFTDVEEVVKRASAMGVKRIRFSVMDAYQHTVDEMSKLGYNFDEYYERFPNGKFKRDARPEVMGVIFDFMLSLKDKYDITLGTCAEVYGREGINKEGCLSVAAVNNMLGTHIPDLGTDNNAQRKVCSCYGGKVDALAYSSVCASHCVYCYAKHANDKALEYYNEDGTLKDNNFTRARRKETIEKLNHTENNERPEGNMVEKPVTYMMATQALEGQDVYKYSGSIAFTPVLSYSDKEIIESLRDDIVSGKIPVGTKITMEALGTVSGITESVRILKKADFIYQGSSTPIDASQFNEQELKRLSDAGIQHDEKNVYVPTFSVGLSEKELSTIDKRERIARYKLLSPTEIRAIGVRSMWKVSDIVSKLQTGGVQASRELLGSIEGLSEKDFTGMSRLEILKELGGRVFDVVKESLFAINGSDKAKDIAKKQFIKNNFDLICELAQDFLANNEEVSLSNVSVEKTAVTQELGGVLAETVDSDTAQEIMEKVGSAAEHWQVGFRQVSAISSLSAMVRRTLSSFIDLDANGNAIKEEFGPKLLDTHTAILDMLHWVSGAKDSDDMIERLEQHLSTSPWLAQLVGEYHEDGDPTKPAKKGILVDPENGQLKSMFFTNFSKYFQPYIVMYKNDAGDTMIREVNTKQFAESAINDLKLADAHKDLGYLTIWNKEGGLSGAFNELWDIVGIKAYKNPRTGEVRNASGLQAVEDKITKEDLENLRKALILLNLVAPSVEELEVVFTENNVEDFKDVANRLWHINQEILKREDSWNKNPNNGFTLFGTNNSIKSNIEGILNKLSPVLHTNMEAVSYEAGKMHYGYVQPSYLNMHIADLRGEGMDDKKYSDFLNKNFKAYDGWYYSSSNRALAGRGWLNEWMEILESDKQYRNMLKHVASLAYEGTGYTDKINPQMWASMMSAYFYDKNATSAYYRVMLLSNKPSEEYIRFVRFTKGYKDHIATNVLMRTFMAEVNRIRTVKERLDKVKNGTLDSKILIENLETGPQNGTKFYFLKFLNEEMERGTKLGKLTERFIDGTLVSNPKDAEYINFMNEFDTVFRQSMDKRFTQFLDTLEADGAITRSNGMITSVYGVQDKVGVAQRAKDNLEEFFWNDWYAQVNMQQILFGDPAQYSNAEDLQKRAAELHAPGMRPDISALDITKKKPVTDGFQRFLVLDDIIKPSEAVAMLEKVHAKLLADPKFTKSDGTLTPLGEEKSKTLKKIRDMFEEDNLTDGQAVISPTGLRKIMHMFGKWDMHMEDIYNRLMQKESIPNKELDVIWPIIKPFSYSVISRSTGTGVMPFFSMGVQQKNSMFPIVLAASISKEVGEENIFTALYEVMEGSSRYGEDNDGIDGILFRSNLKTGASGSIDISSLSPQEVKKVLTEKMMRVDGQTDTEGNQKIYNENYVYEIPWSDWAQQQEVPNHFEGTQQKGSQQRILSVADTPNTHLDENGNEVDNEITVNLLGKDTKMTVAEAKRKYFEVNAANIDASAQNLAEQLALDVNNKKLRNIALSRILTDELRRDGRYGFDMIRAISVDKNGDFITSLSDPMLAGVIQQMANSLIKNRIYKQQIAGGPLVQVSSFGLSEELKIVYSEDGTRPLYAEVMISAPEEFYRHKEFLDENGELSIELIEKYCPKALEMIGYRIPTEAKYSMLPMKVVGFLPRSTESIMLPKEITVLSGSDFDVDKLYIMRQVFEKVNGAYTTDVRDTRDRNNNISLDIAWAFLTAEMNADQTISAGQFDELKRVGYSIAATDNFGMDNPTAYKETLKDKSPKTLKNEAYKASDLMFVDTQVKFFHQNMVAAKLIGVFAQANTSHAFVSMMRDEKNNPTIKVDEHIKLNLKDRNGVKHTLSGNVPIDTEFDWTGLKRISAAFAECIGASVDAVKDPVFNFLNVNMVTVNVFATMLRFGWDAESIGWFLSTPIIKELVKQYEILNAEGSANIYSVVENLKNTITEGRPVTFDENYSWGLDDFVKYHNMPVTAVQKKDESDEDFLRRKFREAQLNWQMLEMFSRMQSLADTTRSIVHITRINSISSAPGPFAANTFADDLKTESFFGNPALKNVWNVFNNPVIYSFWKNTSALVQRVLGDNMVQAGPLARQIYETLGDMFGYANDDLLQKMSEFMTSYLVNYISPVFNLSQANRRNMLLGFPNLFKKLQARYSDNILVKSIAYKQTTNGQPYLELKTRGIQNEDLADLSAAWDTLLREEDKRLSSGEYTGIEAENLAIKLVEYNFFRGGFGFDSKTFTRLVPESVKDRIPKYRENTAALTGLDPDSIDVRNLIFQFMLNTGRTNMPLQNSLAIQNTTDGKLFVTSAEGTKAMLKNEGIVGVRGAGRNITYYYVKFNPQAGIYELTKVSKLGGNNFGFEIDPRTDFRDMKSGFEEPVTTQEGSNATPNDSESDLDALLVQSSENLTTTQRLISRVLGDDWIEEHTQDSRLDSYSAFKDMTDMFFYFRDSGVTGITQNDNFVAEELSKVNFNLSRQETEDMMARVIERLNEQNICR